MNALLHFTFAFQLATAVVIIVSDVRPWSWTWPEAMNAAVLLGLAGQVLALALADAVKLRYINSNI